MNFLIFAWDSGHWIITATNHRKSYSESPLDSENSPDPVHIVCQSRTKIFFKKWTLNPTAHFSVFPHFPGIEAPIYSPHSPETHSMTNFFLSLKIPFGIFNQNLLSHLLQIFASLGSLPTGRVQRGYQKREQRAKEKGRKSEVCFKEGEKTVEKRRQSWGAERQGSCSLCEKQRLIDSFSVLLTLPRSYKWIQHRESKARSLLPESQERSKG